MKIEFLDLEFTSEYFYIEKQSIVKKITFNNRTLYSKFEQHKTPITSLFLKQHFNNEISLAIPLVENASLNYIVIEYQEDNWSAFYSLVKHLLKSLDIQEFQAYTNSQKNLFQLFIPRKNIDIEEAHREVENIKHLLELKSNKNYKIYPNKNLPLNYNIITLLTEKI